MKKIKGRNTGVPQGAEEASSKSRSWHATKDSLPREKVVVETKIDDENGCRNEARLYHRGSLWFFEDGSMYVYYWPTHWRGTGDVSSRAERVTQEEKDQDLVVGYFGNEPAN